MSALRVSSCGLHLDDEAMCVAIGLRLGTPTCADHTCNCAHGSTAWVPMASRETRGTGQWSPSLPAINYCMIWYGGPRARFSSFLQRAKKSPAGQRIAPIAPFLGRRVSVRHADVTVAGTYVYSVA